MTDKPKEQPKEEPLQPNSMLACDYCGETKGKARITWACDECWKYRKPKKIGGDADGGKEIRDEK